jgi:RNA polymerase sigma factor (sigma-70 family)
MSVTELHPGTRRQPPRGRVLSAGEEIALAKRIEQGDLDAKEEMIESNLGLVRALARTYRGRGVPFDDLVQEGTVGLVKAVERFDYRREVKFSTYAVWWIRRSLFDALAGANVIRIPPRPTGNLPRCGARRASSSGSSAARLRRGDRGTHPPERDDRAFAAGRRTGDRFAGRAGR